LTQNVEAVASPGSNARNATRIMIGIKGALDGVQYEKRLARIIYRMILKRPEHTIRPSPLSSRPAALSNERIYDSEQQ